MKKIEPCHRPEHKGRHKWVFVRNKEVQRSGHGWAEWSLRGFYRCACGQTKLGAPQS